MELRHEASHKHMPPLAILRSAAKAGLVWLRENFWAKQCGSADPQKVVEELVYAPNINGVEGMNILLGYLGGVEVLSSPF